MAKKAPAKQTASPRVGDLVVAVFDEALRLTSDPRRAADLAAQIVAKVLLAHGDRRIISQLATT